MRLRERTGINFSFVGRVIGLICLFETIMMVGVFLTAAYYGEPLLPSAVTAGLYLLVGAGLIALSGQKKIDEAGRREGMLTVTATWVVLSLIAVCPFLLSRAIGDFPSALFETLSGFTTTGATVIEDVEVLPHYLLFWRALMQWQGGIGIVVATVALLPLIGAGSSQIYNAETPGITHDRFLPRIKDVAKRMYILYIGITLLCTLLLWLGPMNLFEAVCHTLTCVSTGGFSTRNASIAAFDSPYTEYVMTLFMSLSAVNMTVIYFLFTRKFKKSIKDEEVKAFFLMLGVAALLTTFWLKYQGIYDSWESSFRHAVFTVASLGSSTGFSVVDITLWMPFFWMIAIILSYINGCSGSTAGGLKMSRFIVLVKNLGNEFKKITHPHLVTPVIYNGKQLGISVVHQILAFSMLYTMLIIVGALILMVQGNGFLDSISLTLASVSNTGMSAGVYASNCASLDAFSKLILAFMMLAGRLEVFTVITLFSIHFWKK